jgi:hypothetical protein
MQNFPKIPGLFSKQIISVFFSKILSTLPVPGKASDINYQFCQTSRLFQVFSAIISHFSASKLLQKAIEDVFI